MDNTEADKLLDRWGEWSRSNIGNGYSATNIIGRIMVEGAGASHDGEYQGIVRPEDIAICEKAITRMNRPMKRTTKCKYLWGLTIKDGSDRMKCSESTYRRRIVAIQWFIAERFI